MHRLFPLTLLPLVLAACSSVVEGTSQSLSFTTDPPGAACTLFRNGQAIGDVITPGSVMVEKTQQNIQVLCRKEGFEDKPVLLVSQVTAATFGNVLLGQGIGWAVDQASGAENIYPPRTEITLSPRKVPR